jgi:hypothetical protein
LKSLNADIKWRSNSGIIDFAKNEKPHRLHSNPSFPYPLSLPSFAMATVFLRSLAMAMADTALPPAHKLLPTVSLPLLPSSTRTVPLLLCASRRLPPAPLVASSDAVETNIEWVDEEEEEEAGEAFYEEGGDVEEEVLASGDEGEGEYAAVEPPEEAKVYVGNLPYDIESEGLAQLFDQAGVVEVAEVSRTRLTPKFPIDYDVLVQSLLIACCT